MYSEKLKAGKFLFTGYRLYKAFLVSCRYSKKVFRYAIKSKETATFTYNLTPENEAYLINLVADIVKTDIHTIGHYFQELKSNLELRQAILHHLSSSVYKKKKDKRCDYGSKLAFYAIIRVMKPKVVVENGVEVGFTSIILCEALKMNIKEGHKGRFIGLDINKYAGDLIKAEPQYGAFSKMKYGDAIESLKSLNEKVDFYFSDGLRTYQYEKDEFACLKEKLNDGAIVITNKASFSKALFEVALSFPKKFSFFKEQPLDHWYEGAGIGIMHS